MKEITPTGWLIDDGGAWQFTTKSEDLAVAKRFNWKITPLYSEQTLADIRAEAVIDAANAVVRHNECGFCLHCLLIDHANKLKGGE